jgi:hypothetical protein
MIEIMSHLSRARQIVWLKEKKMKAFKWALPALLIAAAPKVGAQSADQHAGMDHSAMAGTPAHGGKPVPVTEGGQAAFAALTEIISRLEADPATDWSKVDIESVRLHLIDMDNVVMRTDVSATEVPGGARFVITPLDERARQSLERMVRLHSAMANSEGRFHYSSSIEGNRSIVTVLATKPEEVSKVRALGFHGLLTDGVHHQRHHWAMARGIPMH